MELSLSFDFSADAEKFRHDLRRAGVPFTIVNETTVTVSSRQPQAAMATLLAFDAYNVAREVRVNGHAVTYGHLLALTANPYASDVFADVA